MGSTGDSTGSDGSAGFSCDSGSGGCSGVAVSAGVGSCGFSSAGGSTGGVVSVVAADSCIASTSLGLSVSLDVSVLVEAFLLAFFFCFWSCATCNNTGVVSVGDCNGASGDESVPFSWQQRASQLSCARPRRPLCYVQRGINGCEVVVSEWNGEWTAFPNSAHGPPPMCSLA